MPSSPIPTSVLTALTQGSSEIVAVFGGDGVLRFVNRAIERVLGYEPSELVGAAPRSDLVHPRDHAAVAATWEKVVIATRQTHPLRVNLRHRDGSYVPFDVAVAGWQDDPSVAGIVVHAHPLPMDAAPASGPHGRPAFLSSLGRAVERSRKERRYGFAVLLVCLDRFDRLQGSLGYEDTERLLAQTSERLQRLIRRRDTAARVGDAEFAILLDGLGKRGQARLCVDRIERTFHEPFRVKGQEVAMTVSVGIATSERRYADAEQVLRDAKAAVSRAHERGAAQRAIFETALRQEDMGKIRLHAGLRQALDRGELRVVYQPIVSLTDRGLVGFEALARWSSPSLGDVSPVEFIPVAEETGLILEFGGWVLREACQQIAAWNAAHRPDPPVWISVNLSPKQFGDEGLLAQIEKAVAKADLDCRLLVLELTESAVLDDRRGAVKLMRHLRSRGMSFSLDDFGTGYSSLSNLHELPFRVVKIDRSFVSMLDRDPERVETVRAIVQLVHSYGLEVVAEGVETAAQATLLTQMVCEKAQGYHFARPLEVADAEALVAGGKSW